MPVNIRTPEQIGAEQRREQDQAREAQARQRAAEIAARTVADRELENLPDEDVETLTYLYDEWQPDGSYERDQRRRYAGILWRCVQSHDALPDRFPGNVPALWTRFREPQSTPEPWEQLIPPDVYNTGARVTHPNPQENGAVWVYRSKIDANTAEPGQDPTNRWWEPVAPI